MLSFFLVWGVLYSGASWQMFWSGSDAAYYQCYAVAFWQGWSGLQKLPPEQCTFLTHPDKNVMLITQDDLLQLRLPSGLIQFLAAQSSEKPYHTLPHEYPWITLLPFSLALIVPVHWYQVAFAIEMFLLIGSIYVVLSRQAALAYALCMLIGGGVNCNGTHRHSASRAKSFCLNLCSPEALELGFCLISVGDTIQDLSSHLVGPICISSPAGYTWVWSKWLPVALFMGICVLVTGISLALNVVGTLAPLVYFCPSTCANRVILVFHPLVMQFTRKDFAEIHARI